MSAGHHANYWLIFLALCVCTALSVIADLIHLDNKILVAFIVLSIASAKALFVMTYFMHLKFEGAWKFVILAPTAILAMGLMLALLPDIGVHYYPTDVPQNRFHAEADPALSAEELVPAHPLEPTPEAE
jgi:cytochrome c oxidase subunit 4